MLSVLQYTRISALYNTSVIFLAEKKIIYRAKYVCPQSGRKIHAGTRHYAVLPLSFAVKPLNCVEGARHDLLPCPDCQNRGKSPCQTDHKPQYLFSLLHVFCATKVRVKIIIFLIV